MGKRKLVNASNMMQLFTPPRKLKYPARMPFETNVSRKTLKDTIKTRPEMESLITSAEDIPTSVSKSVDVMVRKSLFPRNYSFSTNGIRRPRIVEVGNSRVDFPHCFQEDVCKMSKVADVQKKELLKGIEPVRKVLRETRMNQSNIKIVCGTDLNQPIKKVLGGSKWNQPIKKVLGSIGLKRPNKNVEIGLNLPIKKVLSETGLKQPDKMVLEGTELNQQQRSKAISRRSYNSQNPWKNDSQMKKMLLPTPIRKPKKEVEGMLAMIERMMTGIHGLRERQLELSISRQGQKYSDCLLCQNKMNEVKHGKENYLKNGCSHESAKEE